MEVKQDDKLSRRRGYEGRVDVEHRGRTHYGRFAVEGKIIRVSYEGQQRSAQLGDSPVDFLAKIMLLELVVRAWASDEVGLEGFV